MIGEAEHFTNAKLFCEANNAQFPHEKLDFLNNKSHSYWIEVEVENELHDPQLLEALEHFKKITAHSNAVVSIITESSSRLAPAESRTKTCIYLHDMDLQDSIFGDFDRRIDDHQVGTIKKSDNVIFD